MKRLLFILLAVFLSSCATVGKAKLPRKVEHVYLEPVTNRTGEEGLDVIFTRVADKFFYSDPRFDVDLVPVPDRTLVIKPSVDSISTFAVGFDRKDVAREYRMSIRATVKVFKYGFKKPLYTFSVERYDFYDTYGTATAVEQKRKKCIERIANQIFREIGERLFVEGSKRVP